MKLLFGMILLLGGCHFDREAFNSSPGDCVFLNGPIVGRGSEYILRVYAERGLVALDVKQHNLNDEFNLGWYGLRPIDRWTLGQYYIRVECPDDRKGWTK